MPRNIRPIRVEGQLAYVPLTQGYEAVIDAADVPLVDCYNWRADVRSKIIYAVRTSYSGQRPNAMLMHRVIMGEPHGMYVDHQDGDGLNNRRNNLREATPMQNMHNRRINANNKSGFKGVSLHRRTGKWVAQIRINGEKTYLGYYQTPEKAHAAYCAASAKHHGEFGCTT